MSSTHVVEGRVVERCQYLVRGGEQIGRTRGVAFQAQPVVGEPQQVFGLPELPTSVRWGSRDALRGRRLARFGNLRQRSAGIGEDLNLCRQIVG